MKVILKQKLLMIVFISLVSILFFTVKVYATDTSFSLEKEKLNLSLNDFKYLIYTGGTGQVEWNSSDESVVTVDNGKVTGHSIGTAIITATRGEETDSCEINVIYNSVIIGGNYGNNISNVNLVLDVHPSENLYATVKDGKYETVNNAKLTWSSSDTSIVTVDENTGTITGLKAGTATITVSAEGVTDTCEVKVANGPVYTNFSDAKYELLYDTNVDLKITGVTPKDKGSYHYIITSNNTKPTISINSFGRLDTTNLENSSWLLVNTEENYIYCRNLDKYVELNQDIYLWIIEDVSLEASYALNENENNILYSSKFVAEGIKLEKPKLPQLNLILKTFYIWGGEEQSNNEELTYINFRFPSGVENRKFKLKIGKVTDNTILKKIKDNDYSGVEDLLTYAKNNSGVYAADLTTTNVQYYKNEKALFDGIKLLQNGAYYFIYVEFDDENGKYCPVEGITLGQAYTNSTTKKWDIFAYTADNFDWNNLSSTPTEQEKKEDPVKKEEPAKKEETDNTIAQGRLPQTGIEVLVIVSVVISLVAVSMIYYKKYNCFRDIN